MWDKSEQNWSFCLVRLSPTYPAEILVPSNIDDAVLERVAQFRAVRRIPAVVWRHVGNGAVLARCSQPEVGWLGWRSSDDENLVRAIADASAFDRYTIYGHYFLTFDFKLSRDI